MPDRKKRRTGKLWIIPGIVAGLILVFVISFHCVTRIIPPKVSDDQILSARIENPSPDFYRYGKDWFKKSKSGLWELYLEGKPFERGVITGKFEQALIGNQEVAFVNEIRQYIPSQTYFGFLKYFIYLFNRNLDSYIPDEYRREIYGISYSASDRFSYLGSNYRRMLNYHSSHDIGHTLQNMGLVGCTSFGVWAGRSKDSSLLIGRNFDFYAGDEFARNKVVCFERPETGYPFMMITWPSMIGVTSGMNLHGLTVSINAARSDIPFSAKMPVSILAREILQYAKNIREATAIARTRETFISESILIGSAEDNKAVIIEKSPDRTEIYDPGQDYIVCANHFQSSYFFNLPVNARDRAENASLYRQERVVQDISDNRVLDANGIACILRDRSGLNNADLGMGNEKAINQLIGHHSVIFDATNRLAWVSTGPWQLGPYVCYDLKKIILNFAALQENVEITEEEKAIPADLFLNSANYKQFLVFRQLRKSILAAMKPGKPSKIPESEVKDLIASNPGYYEVWSIAGDYFESKGMPDSSIVYYRKALGMVIPRWNEKKLIIGKLTRSIMQTKHETE
jgi:isopenicillin-N N-acyltransferase like protein